MPWEGDVIKLLHQEEPGEGQLGTVWSRPYRCLFAGPLTVRSGEWSEDGDISFWEGRKALAILPGKYSNTSISIGTLHQLASVPDLVSRSDQTGLWFPSRGPFRTSVMVTF